jgi:4-aminobutyrate aminotransferase-like enzyme
VSTRQPRAGRSAGLPKIVISPPGPRSRSLARDLDRLEAPGVNTIPSGGGGELPILWRKARGAMVHDVDGNRYLDLTSGFGVAAVGHRHPAVVAALRRQSGKLLHGLGDVHAHPLRIRLAARLAALAPVNDAQVFFAGSGSEAIEIALKTALAATGRPGIVAFTPSYHGLTLGALAVTSRPEFRQPFAPWLHPHVRRLPFGCPLERVAEALAGTTASSSPPARGGPASPVAGALLLEPIVGREGVLLPPPGWVAAVAALCGATGTLLIADEIFTGFGRTGSLFAMETEGARPDLLCCGKALGGGLPIAAVLASRDLFKVWETPGEALHTSTFVANPLACATALAVLAVLDRESLPARAARLGQWVAARLAIWPALYPAVQEVRGRGLLWGIELRSARAAARWVAAARRRGILLLAGGPEGRVAQVVPPLTIRKRQLTCALGLLEEALAEAA